MIWHDLCFPDLFGQIRAPIQQPGPPGPIQPPGGGFGTGGGPFGPPGASVYGGPQGGYSFCHKHLECQTLGNSRLNVLLNCWGTTYAKSLKVIGLAILASCAIFIVTSDCMVWIEHGLLYTLVGWFLLCFVSRMNILLLSLDVNGNGCILHFDWGSS